MAYVKPQSQHCFLAHLTSDRHRSVALLARRRELASSEPLKDDLKYGQYSIRVAYLIVLSNSSQSKASRQFQ